jgi:membrane-associated protease RseP (regulator of RpoE activity)
MWKTERGRELIERIARPARFWRYYGDAAIAIVAVTMIATTILLIWEATVVQTPAVRQNAPSPQLLLGLPGINPLIPLWYGIFGLTIAIVLHEFAHGVLSRVAGVRIKSLGAIFLLVPMGAFVEPDEDEMKALPRRQRGRLYAVGPATNMILAVIFAVLFSSMTSSSLVPVHEGIGVVSLSDPTSPAAVAGVQPLTIITAYNNTTIRTAADFQRARALTSPGATIPVTTYNPANGTYWTYSVTLGDDGSGGPLLGIYAFDTGTEYFAPLANADRFGGVPGSVLVYISLPFQGRAPIQEPATHFYRIQGPWSAVPAPLYYLLANVLYWLFWLNVMLGATNALPAVPLDGGYLFKDGLDGLVSRLRRGIAAEAKDRIVKQVSYLFAFFILALILWQLIGPRI